MNGVLIPTESCSAESELHVPVCWFGEEVSPITALTPADHLGFVPAVLGVIR